jgi:hypothetical protein
VKKFKIKEPLKWVVGGLVVAGTTYLVFTLGYLKGVLDVVSAAADEIDKINSEK